MSSVEAMLGRTLFQLWPDLPREKDELENTALESTRTIDIDEFVPKSSIDPRYLIRPYGRRTHHR
jgi:hypothetical protein